MKHRFYQTVRANPRPTSQDLIGVNFTCEHFGNKNTCPGRKWANLSTIQSPYRLWWSQCETDSFDSPDIRLTALVPLDTHSCPLSAKDTRTAHLSNRLRRLRHLAKAQTLRSDMLTCNNRVTSQQQAAILNETKVVARSARHRSRRG